jgi:pimeloyl-ACP methyl ester carboxylesterase
MSHANVNTSGFFAHLNSTIVRFSFRFIKHSRHALSRAGMRVAATVAPRAVLARASEIFITPPRFAHSEPEKRLLEAGEPMRIDTDLGAISAWRFGELAQPCVIMSHGWGGRGAQFRAFVPRLLAQGYQVILFDHIGHGFSDGRQAALVHFWRGVEAVWDHAVQRRIDVVGLIGHSLGGAAVASALRRPLHRTQTQAPMPRAVLISPPESLIGYSRLFVRYLGIPERIRAAMQWRFEQNYGVKWQEFELPNSVENIQAPSLFIHDMDDRETRASGSMALARAWPDARFHATHGLGHRRILRDRATIQAAIDFIGDQVEFQHPPAKGERTSYDEPAPLY